MKTGTRFALVKGVGIDYSSIGSFDSSLLSAGVSEYNLVKVSSILPANMIFEKNIDIDAGDVVFIAYATKTVKSSSQVAAAIAIALPKDKSQIGVIMEVTNDSDENKAIEEAIHLAKNAMTKRGFEVERVLSCGISAIGSLEEYTTVFAGVVMF